MAGKAAELGGVRVSDYLSVGGFYLVWSRLRWSMKRSRHTIATASGNDLPAHAVAYYVMALSLYRGVNTEEVLRVVTEGMDYLGEGAIRRKVGKSGISASRTRLGADVMRYIAGRALTPFCTTS